MFLRIFRRRYFSRVMQLWRHFYYILFNGSCRIHNTVKISSGVYLETHLSSLNSFIEVGSGSKLESGVRLECWRGDITVGRRTYLGPGVIVYGHGGVCIGDDSLIAMGCTILSSDHAIPDAGVLIRSCENVKKKTRIGNDVWLGARVVVTGGVEIGDGCVVGAGAVVTKSLPCNAVAYGVPAEIVRYRKSGSGKL